MTNLIEKYEKYILQFHFFFIQILLFQVLFDRLLRYCDTQSRLLTTALALTHKRQEVQRSIRTSVQERRWGLTEGEGIYRVNVFYLLNFFFYFFLLFFVCFAGLFSISCGPLIPFKTWLTLLRNLKLFICEIEMIVIFLL